VRSQAISVLPGKQRQVCGLLQKLFKDLIQLNMMEIRTTDSAKALLLSVVLYTTALNENNN
jgi:hypothetical protein